MNDLPTLLTIRNLTKQFGGITALKNINFTIKKGAITALIGPNGAGKTTLFNCLTGFYYSEGELLLHLPNKIINIPLLLGGPLQVYFLKNPRRFLSYLYYKMFGGAHLVARSGIARTFQNIRLFKEMTVIENLLIAQHLSSHHNLIAGLLNTPSFKQCERNAIENAYHWLKKFNLEKQANQLAGELAYGQQRLLEIARCMCIRPILLCLDEPAAGLNPMETQTLSHVISELQQEYHLTIILIEHDMSLVMKISNHVIVLDQGEMISSGTPEQVRQDPRVIAAYLGTE
ncbi:MAG: ABC transporter ATP-binding protein [Candidatus Berkiellales bacterium]